MTSALYKDQDEFFLSHLGKLFPERKIFRTEILEKIKTRILCSITLFFENHMVYEILWNNTVHRGRQQIAI